MRLKEIASKDQTDRNLNLFLAGPLLRKLARLLPPEKKWKDPDGFLQSIRLQR
ncbi:Uncharacterized protein APZ42_029549 [Daphnia magna]|uniref:Uncharacterized protein n=1 Tax=Daphnia magna TaxID=35525 RepID=A0A164PNN0_9CRUS|nr:Uncharacterized protein APZ42_029549 [Daphnia magna]